MNNVSKYVRDLIRKDKKEAEGQALERLKAELERAFASSDDDFRRITAADVLKRNRSRRYSSPQSSGACAALAIISPTKFAATGSTIKTERSNAAAASGCQRNSIPVTATERFSTVP